MVQQRKCGTMKKRNKGSSFKFQPFSSKQKKLLTWWTEKSPYKDYDMVIAEGSIRAGKTVAMIDSFLMWSLSKHEDQQFIIAGKSMGALKRNVLKSMFQILNAKDIPYKYHRSEHYIEIGSNTYYCFGANNESSQDVLQGLTAAGAYADEVALMPRSFVDQMIGRCSVDDSKVFMNCNPAGPYHWFKLEFLEKAKEKKALVLHFTMDDNLSLAERVKERFKRMFSGVFFKRYILGLWVMAEGVIYDMFNHDDMVVDQLPKMVRHWIGVDYGSSNPTTFILCGLGEDGKFYIIDEYYHASGKNSDTEGDYTKQKSPSMYGDEFVKWLQKHNVNYDSIFIDPSAKGFLIELWAKGVKRIAQAINDVNPGIELVQSIISNDLFRVHRRCTNVLREFSSYVWDEKAQERGEDKPIKQNDHTLDAIRYVANGTRTIWQRKGVA
jgi:PBSX family phage terminase large subunit